MTRVTVLKTYPGQVRVLFEDLKTGKKRTRTVSNRDYDRMMAESKTDAQPLPVQNRRVMLITPTEQGIDVRDIEFEAIRENMVFTVFEADGSEAPGGPWLAHGDAYADPHGVWTIDSSPIDLGDNLVTE